MADSEKVCCCNNIFIAAKQFDIAEFVSTISIIVYLFNNVSEEFLGLSIHLAFLLVEFYGIHKKNKSIILFAGVFRILETIVGLILIICVIYLISVIDNANISIIEDPLYYTPTEINQISSSASKIVMYNNKKKNTCDLYIILCFTFSFRIILLVVLIIYLVWFIFRCYVQMKMYRVVKQNEVVPMFQKKEERKEKEQGTEATSPKNLVKDNLDSIKDLITSCF